MSEKDRAEGTQEEAEPEHRKAGQQCQVLVARREEVPSEKRGKHAVEIEIVPLDQRADRGRADDEWQIRVSARPAAAREPAHPAHDRRSRAAGLRHGCRRRGTPGSDYRPSAAEKWIRRSCI